MRARVDLVFSGVLILGVDDGYGAIGVIRRFGAFLLCAAAYGCLVPSVSVHFGSIEIARLAGWRKLGEPQQ